MSVDIISQCLLYTFLFACMFIDIRTTKIPNLLTFPTAAIAVVLSYVQHGWHGVGQSLLGWLLGAVITVVFGNLPVGAAAAGGGGIHMGDAKMLAAIGAFLGPKPILIVIFYFFLSFGAMSLLLLVRSLPWKQVFTATTAIASGADPDAVKIDTTKFDAQRKALIPLSVAIVIGTILEQLFRTQTMGFLGL
jgi:prepilin peptidase CpaA